MKFGCIENSALSAVDFSLPADTAATQALLASLPHRTQPPAIYIGCSVWAERSFIGKIYPQGTATKDYLKIYSQQLNTVELNATFYSIPAVAQVQKWKASAAPGFKFCPKVPQSISHRNNLAEQVRRLDTFLEAILHLEEALGVIFLQLPPYYQPNRMQALQRLLEQVPKDRSWAVEFRHPAWFSDQAAQHAMFDCLQKQGMIAVISDVAGRRDALHQSLTTDCVFVRFKGYTAQATNYTRIDAWVARLQQWLTQGLKQVYFFLHETDKALCVDLAMYMIKQFNHQVGIHIPLPHLGEQQASLF